MHVTGFTDVEIKGFDLFGTALNHNISAYIYYIKNGGFQAKINGNTSLMYIGKAVKADTKPKVVDLA